MDDEAAVKSASSEFFAALNDMFVGDLSRMTALWSHADDVVYMGPNGIQIVGWPAVLADWEKQAAMKMGGQIAAQEPHVTLGQDLAVTHHLAQGSNTDSDGKPVQVSTRGTNVWRKENGQWKLIAHHSDPLPFLQD